jgi:hypothetical protein
MKSQSRVEQESAMSVRRYIPAIRTKVRGVRLGRLSVRTSDDRELGKLVGFVIDARGRHVRSLVVEMPPDHGSQRSQQVELQLVLVRLDESAHALRLVERDLPSMSAFRPESVSVVDEADLRTPLIHTAA